MVLPILVLLSLNFVSSMPMQNLTYYYTMENTSDILSKGRSTETMSYTGTGINVTNCKVGNCVKLTGSDLLNNSYIPFKFCAKASAEDMSVSFWFNTTYDANLFSRSSVGHVGFSFYINDTGYFSFGVTDTFFNNDTYQVPKNQWNFFTVKQNHTGTQATINKQVVMTTPVGIGCTYGNNDVWGVETTSVVYGYGNVSYDEIRYFNKSLTSRDIELLYNLSYTGYVTNNSINYTSPVKERTSNSFTYNITYDDVYYTSINAVLTYNNTNYTTDKITGGNNVFFYKNITSPAVNSDTNITFYWTIVLNNGIENLYDNSSRYNQTVTNVGFGLCNATYTQKAINFTTYDEDTRGQLLSPTNNNTYAIDIKIGDSTLSYYDQLSLNTSGNSFAICSNNNLTGLRMDYTLQYGSTGHATEYYNVQNSIINTSTLPQNISLYPLLTSNTNYQEFVLKVKDYNLLAISGAVVEIYRKYIDVGTYYLVESPVTDTTGQTVAHLVKTDAIYNIVIRKNGVVLANYQNIQVYCNTLTQECILNLNSQTSSTSPQSFNNYRGLDYSATYDDTTKIYTLTFTVLDTSQKKVDLYGFKWDNTDGTLVCSNTINASSGTLNCDLSTVTSNNILINSYVDGKLLFYDYVKTGYKLGTSLKNIRYILIAFLVPFFVMFALSSGSMAVVLYLLGLIFGITIFAIDTKSILGSGSFFIWFAVAGIILIIKIMKGGVKNG